MKKNNIFKKIIPSLALMLITVGASVGTTYAIFSSNSKSDIAVTAGKVEVVASIGDTTLYSPTLIDTDGTVLDDTNAATTQFYNGGTATVSGAVLNLNHISPGDKVSFPINVTNNSSITIKYRVVFKDITEYTGKEAYKLIDKLVVKHGDTTIYVNDAFIPWTVVTGGASIADVNMSVELPPDAGTEYEGLSASLSFQFEAVQGNVYTEAPSKAKITVYNQTTPAKATITVNDGTPIVIRNGETHIFNIKDNDKVDIVSELNDREIKLFGSNVQMDPAHPYEAGTLITSNWGNISVTFNSSYAYAYYSFVVHPQSV